MKYWDSSAVVPLLVTERETASVRAILTKDTSVIVSVLTAVEVTSALWRRRRSSELDDGGFTLAETALSELERSWNVVLDVDQIQRRARRILAVHALRAADALQLAGALIACDERTALLPFVTLDTRLSAAARREGFAVLPV